MNKSNVPKSNRNIQVVSMANVNYLNSREELKDDGSLLYAAIPGTGYLPLNRQKVPLLKHVFAPKNWHNDYLDVWVPCGPLGFHPLEYVYLRRNWDRVSRGMDTMTGCTTSRRKGVRDNRGNIYNVAPIFTRYEIILHLKDTPLKTFIPHMTDFFWPWTHSLLPNCEDWLEISFAEVKMYNDEEEEEEEDEDEDEEEDEDDDEEEKAIKIDEQEEPMDSSPIKRRKLPARQCARKAIKHFKETESSSDGEDKEYRPSSSENRLDQEIAELIGATRKLWSKEEDKIITLLYLVSIMLKGTRTDKGGHTAIKYTQIRDYVLTYCRPVYDLKTSSACSRRIRNLYKSSEQTKKLSIRAFELSSYPKLDEVPQAWFEFWKKEEAKALNLFDRLYKVVLNLYYPDMRPLYASSREALHEYRISPIASMIMPNKKRMEKEKSDLLNAAAMLSGGGLHEDIVDHLPELLNTQARQSNTGLWALSDDYNPDDMHMDVENLYLNLDFKLSSEFSKLGIVFPPLSQKTDIIFGVAFNIILVCFQVSWSRSACTSASNFFYEMYLCFQTVSAKYSRRIMGSRYRTSQRMMVFVRREFSAGCRFIYEVLSLKKMAEKLPGTATKPTVCFEHNLESNSTNPGHVAVLLDLIMQDEVNVDFEFNLGDVKLLPETDVSKEMRKRLRDSVSGHEEPSAKLRKSVSGEAMPVADATPPIIDFSTLANFMRELNEDDETQSGTCFTDETADVEMDPLTSIRPGGKVYHNSQPKGPSANRRIDNRLNLSVGTLKAIFEQENSRFPDFFRNDRGDQMTPETIAQLLTTEIEWSSANAAKTVSAASLNLNKVEATVLSLIEKGQELGATSSDLTVSFVCYSLMDSLVLLR
ncbi:hypothetical protein Ciccas_004151 [Cichlidogyrus casuarinus]|uniref:Uncharacterized protein n=1 Tax=Cichlidogyrus casuarinus TaxID=1844966 RepID=A0ABD2QCA8_9PLAT